MSMKTNKKQTIAGEFDREMLKVAFSSLFWSIITFKKEKEGFSLKKLADELGVHKSMPSRWFSGAGPNWELNTIADIARSLNVEISVVATDKDSGVIFSPSGEVSDPRVRSVTTANNSVSISKEAPIRTISREVRLVAH